MTLQTLSRPRGVVAPASTPAPAAPPDTGRPRRAARGARHVLRRPGLLLAVAVLLLVAAWAVVPQAFTAQDPLGGVPADRLQPPSGAHWFGTDHLGRDVYARVVHGASLTLRTTALAVAVGLVVGSLLGLLAGFLRGWVDDVVGRLVDVLLAIPSILLSLAIITALGFGPVKVAVAVGIGSVATFARVMRAEVLRVSTSVYVEAARASGLRWPAVLGRHVLPNSSGPVLALVALDFGTAVLAVSALSFLGYGTPPPAPEWGALVSGGRDYLATAWWLTTLPGLVIVAVVLAANRVSRALEKTGEDQ
ncbi:ABC transporter permease [Isoptericola sp. NPDC019693]|uniref:ABC transporter permease n=1 Tax=Isoptericola sp. NPDC019693 TaxID=3364009 RepID=UPI0037995275